MSDVETRGPIDLQESAPQLVATKEGLALHGDGMLLRADFAKSLNRLKPGKLQQELLVKAAKVKGCQIPLAVDATAGLGEDALLLAAAGFEVWMFERDAVIAALLRDALGRALADERLASVAARMTLFEEDSLNALPCLDRQPQVVVLDPMFPARTKSASVGKKFQLLQQLEQPCFDEEELLEAAYAAHPRKIVIKRPLKGPFLAGKKPSYSLRGKAIRYDCISLP